MTGKRWVILAALSALLVSTGCRHWCENHYPCPQTVQAAPAAGCVPCCVPCATTAASAPAPPPTWSTPAGPRTGTCVCP